MNEDHFANAENPAPEADEIGRGVGELRRELDVMVDTVNVANNRARLVESKLEIAMAALREVATLNAVCDHDRGGPAVRALREIEVVDGTDESPVPSKRDLASDEPSVPRPYTVDIARCPEHGLHGERTECFECGGPVEQVPMVPAGDVERLWDALDTAWGLIANAGRNLRDSPDDGWPHESAEWVAAAERWRDEKFHPLLRRRTVAPENVA